MKLLRSLPHLPFRLAVSLTPIFVILRALQMGRMPGASYNIWGIPGISSFYTALVFFILCVLIILLFTRHYLKAAFGIFLFLSFHLTFNQHFYWAWALITPMMIICHIGSIKSKHAGLKTFFQLAFVFYVAATYVIPCLDRFAYSDWFTGRVVAVLLASQDFARFPFIMTEYWMFAPLSIFILFFELVGPSVYVLIPGKRKIIAGTMIIFHTSLILVSDIEMWHPFMAFVWWELYGYPPAGSLKARVWVILALVALAPYSIIIPESIRELYVQNPGLVKDIYERIIPFRKARMFASDEIFIKRTSMIYVNGESRNELSHSLQPYFLRRYFGFRATKPAQLNGLCESSGKEVAILYEVETLSEIHNQKIESICP